MPDSTVRVGIVIRTKDRPILLARALHDIAAQRFSSWSAVVVNDGGPRGPVDAVIDALPEGVRRKVEVIHHTESLGRSASANVGVRALSCEFVVLHDDDDLWHPEFLAGSVEWLDSHPSDIGVVSRTEIVYERVEGTTFVETSRAPFWADLAQITYADMLQVNRFVPIAYVYRRAVHDEVGLYREDVHAAEDWEFNLRVLRYHSIGFIDGEPKAYWMQRRASTGALGNSMFVLASEHEYYDKLIRDEALREFAQKHGDGIMLYLSRYIQDEVARQLDERRPISRRINTALRAWRRRFTS